MILSEVKQDYLHHNLNPPHDTRHDSKVAGTHGGRRIDEPSQKNSTTRQRDSKMARGRLIVLIVYIYYNASGFIFIPWSYMSPSRLRLTRIFP